MEAKNSKKLLKGIMCLLHHNTFKVPVKKLNLHLHLKYHLWFLKYHLLKYHLCYLKYHLWQTLIFGISNTIFFGISNTIFVISNTIFGISNTIFGISNTMHSVNWYRKC
jgi:hypothetical protein